MSEWEPRLTNVSVIRDNQRFSTYRANYEGRPVFVKQVNNPSLVGVIEREIGGLEVFGELSRSHNLGFSVPELILRGQDYAVTSWAEGKPIVIDPTSEKSEAQIEFFATSLAAIDRSTTPTPSHEVIFDISANDAKSSIDLQHSRMQTVHYPPFVDTDLLDKGFGYVNSNLHRLEGRLAHADFGAGNIIEAEGKYTLVDFEFTSQRWPRFYDLVNLTCNRMILSAASTHLFRQVVNRFFEINSDVEIAPNIAQLNTIAMFRVLALVWQLLTKPNAYHNNQQDMTPELYSRIGAMVTTILDGSPYFEASI